MQHQDKISFVYFDIGGVLILDLTYEDAWEQMLDDLGLFNEKRFMYEKLFDSYEINFNEGSDPGNFIEMAKRELGIEFPAGYSIVEDFVSRFKPNDSLHSIVADIRNKYKVGLLTNMYSSMLDRIQKAKLLPEVEWDVIIDSSVEKCSKPDEAIYVIAEDNADVVSEQILFVDNSAKNIEAAIARGWKGVLYDPNEIESSNNKVKDALF